VTDLDSRPECAIETITTVSSRTRQSALGRAVLSTYAPVALVGALLGAMLGGSALGVAHASSTARLSTSARAGTRLTREAIGVWREIPEREALESAAAWLADALATLDESERGAANRGAGRRARSASATRNASAGVTSDHVPAGPAIGYVEGRPTRITVTRIDGKPVEVRTALAFERMRSAAARDGVQLRIVSGFRTMEHQQALYAAYLRGRGNLAARPGESNHQSGHALDLNASSPGVLAWLERNARRFGFRRTVPSEPWHWEWW
jgi:hypothetical protein